MKHCAKMRKRMSEAVDGRLEGGVSAEFMRHIENCAECRRAYDALCNTVSLMRKLPPVEPPADMAARVRRRLGEAETPRFSQSVFLRPPVRVALAASLLVVLSVYVLLRPELFRDREHRPAEIADERAVQPLRELDVAAAPSEPEQPPAPRRMERLLSAPERARAPAMDSTLAAPPPALEGDGRVRQGWGWDSFAGRESEEGLHAGKAARHSEPEPLRRAPRPADRDLSMAVAAAVSKPAPDPDAALADGSRAFAADMYRELAGPRDGNLFFSPYSVASALSMTYAGARGETEAEMAAALHWPLDRAALHPAARDRDRRVMAAARDTGQILNIANGLCLTGGDVDEAYKALLRDYYAAEMFVGGAAEINEWVARKTEGTIERILDELSPESVCVILNAVYFKGRWQQRFDPDNTEKAPFHISPTRRADVQLMHLAGRYRLLDEDDFQAIEIPYEGGRLSMIVFLPREIDGLAALETDLSAQALSGWREALSRQPERRVELYLPKFKMETEYDLVPACRRLGMRDAFARGVADFSGMGWPRGELWISQIKHKAYVDVDEKGTEAAAVTAVEMRTTAMPAPAAVFRADRPFMFLIQENETGAILFMGRLREIDGNK